MTDDIIIDGVTMPTPALGGLTIKKEKVWSNNTGRVANGDMVGDLIAIKYTLEITWPMLSRADAAKIDAAISPAFFNVTFTDPGSNSRITKRCYSNTPSYGNTTTTNPVLANAINNANANAVSAVSKVNNLSVGGRNLVLNSHKLDDKFYGAGGYLGTFTVVSDSEALSKYHVETKCTTAGAGPHYPIFQKTADKIGKTYTWSFWAKCSVAKTGSVGHESGGQTNISLTTSWKKFSHTWVYADAEYYSFTFYLGFKVGEILYIRDFKIEEGTQATTWTPAPEDVDNKVSTANTNASNAVSTANTANSTANTAKSTADAAKSSAASAVSTANTANSTANTAKTTASNAASTANTAIPGSQLMMAMHLLETE